MSEKKETNINNAYQRLKNYVIDLEGRLEKQRLWHERNSGINPFNSNEYSDELHASDPYPFTNDIISAQRFLDLMTIAIAALEASSKDRSFNP